MARKYVWPEGHWGWPIKLTHKHGLKCGEMCFVGGQIDTTPDGAMCHPGDLEAQIETTVGHIATVLGELGADLEDVVKLVVFYVNQGDVDERMMLDRLRTYFPGPVPPAVMPVPLPALAYPGMMVEIEAIAMRAEDGSRMPRTAARPPGHWDWPFSHGLKCGEMIFVGAQMPLDAKGAPRAPDKVVEQAEINIENIRRVLAELGAEPEDVARINTFYVGQGTTEDWAEAAMVRANAFPEPGPCGTGVPVPALWPAGVTIRQEAFAMRGADGRRLERRALSPPGHWDWPIPVTVRQGVRVGNMVCVGGQVSADQAGVATHAGDMAAQTRAVMDFIRRVLESLGAGMDDVVKVNCFYKGDASYEALHENLSIRSASFREPGPTTTGIPLPELNLDGIVIEVEAYAMLE